MSQSRRIEGLSATSWLADLRRSDPITHDQKVVYDYRPVFDYATRIVVGAKVPERKIRKTGYHVQLECQGHTGNFGERHGLPEELRFCRY